jgi:hypothetical protein
MPYKGLNIGCTFLNETPAFRYAMQCRLTTAASQCVVKGKKVTLKQATKGPEGE